MIVLDVPCFAELPMPAMSTTPGVTRCFTTSYAQSEKHVDAPLGSASLPRRINGDHTMLVSA